MTDYQLAMAAGVLEGALTQRSVSYLFFFFCFFFLFFFCFLFFFLFFEAKMLGTAVDSCAECIAIYTNRLTVCSYRFGCCTIYVLPTVTPTIIL